MHCAVAAESLSPNSPARRSPFAARTLAWQAAGALWLAALATQAQTAAPAQPGAHEYVSLAGDTCASISKTFWPNDPKAIDKFHALNPQLGRSPHKLHPGIKLIVAATGADARLTFLKPAVKKKPAKAPEWKPAEAGDDLFRLDEVNTLQGAGAEVTFQDGTSLQLDENALIVIYGRAQTPAQLEKSGEVEIVQGEAGLKLSALRGEPLAVQTPAGRVTARSKDLRVGVDAQKMSRVAIYQGSAEVKAEGAQVHVPDGFGTRVAQGEKPEKPRPLPDAPAWTTPLLRDLRISLGGAGATLALEWSSVERGARYRVQLARDEAFNDRLLDATLDAARPRRAEARALPPGNYFARVSAIDDQGLRGKSSLVREVQVRAARAENALPEAPLRGVGELRFVFDPDLEVKVDGKPAAPIFSLRELGKHEVQVALPGATPEAIACEVLPPRAQLNLERAEATLAIPRPPAPSPARLPSAGLLGQPAAVVAASPLPGPWIDRASIVELRAQPELGSPASRANGSLGSLAAQVATEWGALGGSYTVQHNPAPQGPSPLGQGSFWFLGSLLEGETALAVGLDLAFPGGGATTGVLHSPRARIFLSGGKELGQFAFSTTQALALSNGIRVFGTVGWDSKTLASIRVAPRLALVAELDGIVGEGRALAAFAGSAGARFQAGPIELGVALRTGLFGDGRFVWGQPALLISASLRLPRLSLARSAH